MQAVILVGGEGTRLRPLTSNMPKPIVPLVDRPFMAFMLGWLKRHGVDDAIMSCGFLATKVKDVLGDGSAYGINLRFVEEPEPRGTAGALKYAEEFLQDRFLMLNGDVLSDMDLTAQIRQHEETGAIGTLALVGVPDPSAYGLVRLHEDNSVKEFVEKPSADQIDTNMISAGAYVLERSVLDMIPAGENVSIERRIWPALVGNGLYAYPHEAYWLDIGTPAMYLKATRDILDGTVETAVTDAAAAARGEGVQVADTARVDTLSVLREDVTVGAGSVVEGAVLHAGVRVGERCTIRDCTIAAGAAIGDGTVVDGGALIGEGVTIGAGNVLTNGIKVFPGTALGDGAVKF